MLLVVFLATFSASYGQIFGGKTIRDNGNIIVKERSVNHYNKVIISTPLDVVLVNDPMGKIRLEVSENLEPYLITSVSGNALNIELRSGNRYHIKHKAVVYVPVNETLESILLSGSGDISADHTLNVSSLSCEVSGAGDVELNIQAKSLSLKVSGSGDIEVQGSSEKLTAVVTGAGDISAKNLKSQYVTAKIVGSGDISVFAQKEIKASITGSGDISISGKPAKQDTSVIGSGDINFY